MTSWLMVCRPLRTLLVAAMLMPAAACESGSSSPTAPSGTLQVTLDATVLKAGDVTTARATSAGTPPSALVWASSNETVATVDPLGAVRARRAGRATLTARTETASGQAALRVVSDYEGAWSGPITRAQPVCAVTSTAPVCAASPPPATLLAPVTLTVVQTGATVTGTLIDALEPGASVILSGEVADDDTLTLTGSTAESLGPATRQLTVTNFRATYDPSLGTITGSYTVVAAVAGPAGAAVNDYTYQAQFRDLPHR